jgi:phosphoglycerate dehydrogenase-like enzyme
MIGEAQLRAMRPTAYLINVARGSLVVEADLARALREGWIAGACLDALVGEPIGKESPMWDVPNLVITPHSAFRSPHGIERSLNAFKANLERYLRGEPLQDVLDVSAGY